MWIVNRISTDYIHTVSRLFFTARRAVHRPVHNLCNIFVNNMLFYISPVGNKKSGHVIHMCPVWITSKRGMYRWGCPLLCMDCSRFKPRTVRGDAPLTFNRERKRTRSLLPRPAAGVDWTGVLATRSVRSRGNGYGMIKGRQ